MESNINISEVFDNDVSNYWNDRYLEIRKCCLTNYQLHIDLSMCFSLQNELHVTIIIVTII